MPAPPRVEALGGRLSRALPHSSRSRRARGILPVTMSSSMPPRLACRRATRCQWTSARIDPAALVGEVVMKQEIHPFLRLAKDKGCAIQVGTEMLFEQIPAYIEFFGFGRTTSDELRCGRQNHF